MAASYPSNEEGFSDRNEDDDRPVRPLADRREMHLLDALFVLRKKLALIIFCGSLGLLLALLATWMMQIRYSSTVIIQIHREGGSALSLGDLAGIGSQIGMGDETSTELLTDETVIGNEDIAIKVIESLSLAGREPFVSLKRAQGSKDSGPAAWENDLEFRDRAVRLFQSRLRVSLVKGTRLITVTYTDEDPQQAAAVANAVVEAYLIEVTQQRYNATSKTSRWLTEQISDLKTKVSESQNKVNAFRQKVGIVGVPPVADAQHSGQSALEYDHVELDRLADLNRQLTAAEVARISSEAIYHLTESQNPDLFLGIESSQIGSNPSGASLLSSASQDIGLLRQLRTQQGQLKLELASSMLKYGQKNPVIVGIQTQLTELDHQMAEEMRRIGIQAKNNFDLAAGMENSIRQSVDKEKDKIAQLNNSADQLLMLQQEEASNRSLYESLYGKLEAASVLAGAQSSNVTIVNPARVPSRPSRPKSAQNLALGLLAGLAIGVFGAFVSNYRDDAISTPDDVSSFFGYSILGLIPLFDRRAKLKGALGSPGADSQTTTDTSQAWVLRSPKSASAESYRQIRTAILLSRPSKPPQVLLFVSALSGDGKTTSCFNLGFAFGLQGSRVLLIDADLRRPSLHSVLNIHNGEGLSQCLSSELDPRSVIRPLPELPNVSVLTAGPIPPAPSELLGSKRFVNLLESLKSEFDFIFIDAPPILMVTDAVLVAQSTDGIVFIVRAGVTRRAFVRRALELLGGSRNKLLGIVLNALDVHSTEYRTNYGYYGDQKYYGDSHE
jgi:capsular exopolysaccharide synthesis family protein